MKKVIIYTKNFCPFCVRAKSFFEQKKIPFTEINIEQDSHGAEKLFEKTGFRTVPQIFIGDECIGGADELFNLERAGDLDKKLS